MPALALIMLAAMLLELAPRIIEFSVAIKEVLLTHPGKERIINPNRRSNS